MYVGNCNYLTKDTYDVAFSSACFVKKPSTHFLNDFSDCVPVDKLSS